MRALKGWSVREALDPFSAVSALSGSVVPFPLSQLLQQLFGGGLQIS